MPWGANAPQQRLTDLLRAMNAKGAEYLIVGTTHSPSSRFGARHPERSEHQRAESKDKKRLVLRLRAFGASLRMTR
jgi:hypothetical protein